MRCAFQLFSAVASSLVALISCGKKTKSLAFMEDLGYAMKSLAQGSCIVFTKAENSVALVSDEMETMYAGKNLGSAHA